MLDTSGSRLKAMDAEIARQRQQIEAVMAALVTVPGSKALGARLPTEEAKLGQLEAERSALTGTSPLPSQSLGATSAASTSRPLPPEPPGQVTIRRTFAAPASLPCFAPMPLFLASSLTESIRTPVSTSEGGAGMGADRPGPCVW